MVTAAPWVDFALLVVMFLFFRMPSVLQPGLVVRLPESPFAGGTRYGHNMVVLSQETAGRPLREELVFFDDARYLVRDPGQMNDLRAALSRAVRERPELPLVVEADQAVRNGTLVQLFNMAADAGIANVNLATRPPSPP
jgi:biopolymer transport protein ExbD